MKYLCLLLGMILLTGCAGTHPSGISQYDEYDGVTVDAMSGNSVSGIVFQRTLLCLNARREIRYVTVVTNATIASVTNRTVQALTNQTVSLATNYVIAVMTNVSPSAPILAGENAAGRPVETNTLVIITSPPPSVTTNVAVSVANNQGVTSSPNQTAANNQVVRTFNNQITTTSNNLSISVTSNQVVTAETNQVISYATNYNIFSVTNVVVAPTNAVVYDYYLQVELTPPPDFTLQSGESLDLVVDTTRYAFSQVQPGPAVNVRKGFISAFYRVTPEMLVAIANATSVKIRLKGNSQLIERAMNDTSKQNFQTFLLKYFSPEALPKNKVASLAQPTRSTLD